MKLRHAATLALLMLFPLVSRRVFAQTADTQTWDGITIKCSKLGFSGTQAEGFEVVKVDPDSAFAAAGLRGPIAASTPAATPSTLLRRLGRMAVPQPQAGDLIVAINAQRVHCGSDLEQAAEKNRSGDYIYLVIVRSLADGTGKTMRIAIRLGPKSTSAHQ